MLLVICYLVFLIFRQPPIFTLFPYTTLFRSWRRQYFRCPSSQPMLDQTSSQANAESRSEEHTSELQSRGHLVCRLLLKKKNEHRNKNSLISPHRDEQIHDHG